MVLLMAKILHDLKDSKLWEIWYIPYNGYCRILSISSIMSQSVALMLALERLRSVKLIKEGPGTRMRKLTV